MRKSETGTAFIYDHNEEESNLTINYPGINVGKTFNLMYRPRYHYDSKTNTLVADGIKFKKVKHLVFNF